MNWWSPKIFPSIVETHPVFKREWGVLVETNSTEIAFWYELARRVDPRASGFKPFPKLSVHAFNLLKGLWADSHRWDQPRRGYQATAPCILVGERIFSPPRPFSSLIRAECAGAQLTPFYINFDKADTEIVEEAMGLPELGLPHRGVLAFKRLLKSRRQNSGHAHTLNNLSRRSHPWAQLDALDEQVRCRSMPKGHMQQKVSGPERQACYEARKRYRQFLSTWRKEEIDHAVPADLPLALRREVRAQIHSARRSTTWENALGHRIFL